ncbi:MAG: GNAT family N-acetyltransferase [Planctomycetota bacterium]
MVKVELVSDVDVVRQHVSRMLSESAHGTGHTFEPRSVALQAVEHGRIIAGLTGSTNWNWLFIETLAVEPEYQNRGLARELVLKAESIAVSRGCVGSWVDTFTFQAPDFYLLLGYEEFGSLPQYPDAESRIFLRKLFVDPRNK